MVIGTTPPFLMPTWPLSSTTPMSNTKATCCKSKSAPLPVLQSSLARLPQPSFPLTNHVAVILSITVGIIIISTIDGHNSSCENRGHEATRVATCRLPRCRIRYCDHYPHARSIFRPPTTPFSPYLLVSLTNSLRCHRRKRHLAHLERPLYPFDSSAWKNGISRNRFGLSLSLW